MRGSPGTSTSVSMHSFCLCCGPRGSCALRGRRVAGVYTRPLSVPCPLRQGTQASSRAQPSTSPATETRSFHHTAMQVIGHLARCHRPLHFPIASCVTWGGTTGGICAPPRPIVSSCRPPHIRSSYLRIRSALSCAIDVLHMPGVGVRQTFLMHPCLRCPMPPNLGLSRQFLHSPQSSRAQPSHLPQRTLRGRLTPVRRAGFAGSSSASASSSSRSSAAAEDFERTMKLSATVNSIEGSAPVAVSV